MDEDKFIGSVIFDMTQEDFEKNVVEHNLNLGQINSLIFWFNMMYNQFRGIKDVIIRQVTEGERKKDDPEVVNTLTELYDGMTNIELKVVYLHKRYQDLIEAAKSPD